MLKTSIYPHQERCLKWMNVRKGGLIGNDMGTGKTMVMLEYAFTHGALIVVPPSLVAQFRGEVFRHFGYHPNMFAVYHGRGKNQQMFEDYRVVLTTYETILSEKRTKPNSKLFTKKFSTMILDEAHRIRNMRSKTFKVLDLMSAEERWCFTGTPVFNTLKDLRSLSKFIRSETSPGVLRVGETLAENVKEWREQNFFRVSREEVLDLPQITRQNQYLPMDSNASNQEAIQSVKSDCPLVKILRMRQHAVHPGMVNKSIRVTSCPKFDWITKEIQQHDDDAFLIFSQFTTALEMLKKHLENYQVGASLYTGKQSNSQKAASVDRLMHGHDRVLLLNTNTGGVGLNLTQANRVIFLDPCWNEATENQALSRSWRLGQTRPVKVDHLMTLGSIEMWLNSVQLNKMEHNNMFLHGIEFSRDQSESKKILDSLMACVKCPPQEESPLQV